MPIDRADTLRNAEKLIRQGKLPDAIAEYVRLVDDQPGDWNLANSLGDLYSRAGQVDKAIAQFGQISRKRPNAIRLERRRRTGRTAGGRSFMYALFS